MLLPFLLLFEELIAQCLELLIEQQIEFSQFSCTEMTDNKKLGFLRGIMSQLESRPLRVSLGCQCARANF